MRCLLAGEVGTFPEEETVALTFVQHYAECRCHPDTAALQRLAESYGLDAAQDILAYLRMLTFGNLFGNTFDALLSRFSGKPALDSSLWSELGVLLGAMWMPPSRLFFRLFNRKRSVQVQIPNNIQNKEIRL